MATVSYEVSVGAIRATNSRGAGDIRLAGLSCELDMDGVGGRCVFRFASHLPNPPSGGDSVTVGLDAGAGMVRVFTGEVDLVEQSTESALVTASDGLAKLARLDVEVAYEEVRTSFIVTDLLDRAGLPAGEIEQGPSFSSYLIHRGPRGLRHLRRLAELCGANIFTDGTGMVHFACPKQGGPDHRLQYGQNILSIDIWEPETLNDGVVVWGEGAAGTRGLEKAHWLATDLTDLKGQASIGPAGDVAPGASGDNPLVLRIGAVRSRERAQDLAEAWASALSARRVRGRLEVLGDPSIRPGDLVAVQGLPSEQWGELGDRISRSPLKVRRLRHNLDATKGLYTTLEF